jgi:hypothetical protein
VFAVTFPPIATVFLAASPVFIDSQPFRSSGDFAVTDHLASSAVWLESLHFISTVLTETLPLEGSLSLASTLAFVETAPLSFQDPLLSESGSSAGMIAGVTISVVVVVVIGVVLGFFLLRRRAHHSHGLESQSSSDTERSILKMDILEGGDDTMMTTYTDPVTDEGDLQIVSSIPTDFLVDIGSPLNV